MRTSRAVTTRYARALLESEDEGCLKAIGTLAKMRDEKVKNFLNDPTISPVLKAKTIAEVLDTGKRCERMFEIIFQHKRFGIFEELYEIAMRMWMRRTGKERVVVRSAQELEEDEKKEIARIVKEVRKTEPILEIVKDENLLAGVVIDFEDAVVDMSALGALEKAATLMGG